MKLSELIQAKLDEAETEEDQKLREAAKDDTAKPFVDAVMDARQTKKPGSRPRRYRKVSYGTMVLRAHAAGFEKFSKVTLSTIMNEGINEFPKLNTISALAAALRVSESVVVAAICAEVGIHIYQAERPGDPVVIAKGRRSPSQLAAVRRRITLTLDTQTGASGEADTGAGSELTSSDDVTE